MAEEKKSFIRQLLSKEMPGVRRAKEYVDERLTRRIVEPMARKGYEDLGAAIAAIPSTATEFLLPDTVGEAALMAVPAAGKVASKATKAAKAAKEAKFAKEPQFMSEEMARILDKTAKELEDVDDYAKYLQTRHNLEFPKDKMSFKEALQIAREELAPASTVTLRDIRIPSNLKPVK